jgi:uncharacterized protein YjiS (DUF1127 family)
MSMVFLGKMLPKPVDTSLTLEWTPTAARSNREGREPPRDSWLALLRTWYQRRRSRILLSQLDDRSLKDIGLTYYEAEHEANKPFWRP